MRVRRIAIDNARAAEPVTLTQLHELTATGVYDVATPIDIASVGHGNDEALGRWKRHNRSPEPLAALASDMMHHGHRRHDPSNSPEDRVRDSTIHAPHEIGKVHCLTLPQSALPRKRIRQGRESDGTADPLPVPLRLPLPGFRRSELPSAPGKGTAKFKGKEAMDPELAVLSAMAHGQDSDTANGVAYCGHDGEHRARENRGYGPDSAPSNHFALSTLAFYP
jgi:hypothetical protein